MNDYQESVILTETKEERPQQAKEKPERTQNAVLAEEEKPPRSQDSVLPKDREQSYPSKIPLSISDFALNEVPYLLELELPNFQDPLQFSEIKNKSIDEVNLPKSYLSDFQQPFQFTQTENKSIDKINQLQSMVSHFQKSLPFTQIENKSTDEMDKWQNIIQDFQGPLQFTQWTFNIQTVIWLILKGEPSLKFYANEKGELIAAWSESKGDRQVNITESLENHVIFDQIILYSADFTDYLHFLASESIIAKEAWKRAYLFQKGVTTLEILNIDSPTPGSVGAENNPRAIYVQEDREKGKFFAWWFNYPKFENHPIDDEYQEEFKNMVGKIVLRDEFKNEDGEIIFINESEKYFYSLALKCGYIQDKLHACEKIDLNIYSEEYFKIINNFLREFGRRTATIYQEYKADSFQTMVKDILCLTVFSAKGLIKIPSEQGWFYREMLIKGETEKFFDDIKKATEENSSSTRPSKTIKDAFISTSRPDSAEIFNAKDANFFQLIFGEAHSIKKYAAYSKEDEYLMTPYSEFIHYYLLKDNNNYFLLSKQARGPLASYDNEENITGENYFQQALEDHEPQRIVEFNSEDYYYFDEIVKIEDPRYNTQIINNPTGISLIKDYYARKYDTKILFFCTLSFDIIQKKIIPLLRKNKTNNNEEWRKGIILDFGMHIVPMVYFKKNGEEGVLITDSTSGNDWKHILHLGYLEKIALETKINLYVTEDTRQASLNNCIIDGMVIVKDATAICKRTGQYRIPDLFSRITSQSRIKNIGPFLFSTLLPNELLKTTQITAYYEKNKELDNKWVGVSKVLTPSEFREKHTYTGVMMKGNIIKNISSFLHKKEYDYADKSEILFYWNFISQTWGHVCNSAAEKSFITQAKKLLKEQGPARPGNYSGLHFFPNRRQGLYLFSKGFVSDLLKQDKLSP